MHTVEQLIEKAREVRSRAHAPYSEFPVGAVVETRDGSVFTGCNVENASYGLTVCAERHALAAMVAAGKSNPHRLVLVADTPTPCTPCGACRQVLVEFNPDMHVVMVTLAGDRLEMTAKDLLPHFFTFKK